MVLPLSVLAAATVARYSELVPVPVLLFSVLLLVQIPFSYPPMVQAAGHRAEVLDDQLKVADWLKQNYPQTSILATPVAGVVPWRTGFETIDMLGLNDRHIARVEIPEMGTRKAGHEKRDPHYVFSRQPDLFLSFPGDLITDRPKEPRGLPEQFRSAYEVVSIPFGDRWLNFHELKSSPTLATPNVTDSQGGFLP